MTFERSLLRDLALLLLAVVTVAAATYVLTRRPHAAAPAADRLAVASAQPTPSPERTPERDPVTALFLGGDLLLSPPQADVARLTAEQLGWEATVAAAPGAGYVTGPAGGTLADRVPEAVADADADVVVLVSTASETGEADPPRFAGNVQFVVNAVGDALPEARVVVIGPIAPDPAALRLHRQVLTDVAGRFGAFFVDPTGRRYVGSEPGLLAPDGTLTPAGAQEVARRLAADLRIVLPSTLVPSSGPTP